MQSKILINILAAALGFTFCIWTVIEFAIFLSSHTYLHSPRAQVLLSDKESSNIGGWNLCVDLGLLALFMAQHTFQKKLPVKLFFANSGYDVLERLIYNVGTCLALQMMMMYWQPIPSWFVWQLSTSANYILWWLFTIIHVSAWVAIYTGCIVLDMFELMGVKQIYYSIQGWADPLMKKSAGLLRFYQNMRHPGFTAFTVIMFIHPVMQADRLLLAYAFLIYMILAFKIDDVDCSYHRKQLQRKKNELQILSW